MALGTRHAKGSGLSEIPIGSDQNRFDLEDYWDKSFGSE